MSLVDGLLGRRKPMDASKEKVLVNAYATLVDLPPMSFPHVLHGSLDVADEDISQHINGIVGWVMQLGDGSMSQGRYHTWRHLQRVKQIVSFDVLADDLPLMEEWANAANALLFLPDGTLRTPDLQVLFSADRQVATAEALPFPPDAIERRMRSTAALMERGHKSPAGMPPSLGDGELLLHRTPQQVLDRALSLLYVDAIAWVHGTDKQPPPAGRIDSNPVGRANLTESEEAFVASPNDDRASALMWRHEAANVLLWSIGIPGADVFDAGKQIYSTTLWNAVSSMKDEVHQGLSFRPASEILDLTDLVWRQHWNARDAALKGIELQGIDADVIAERHHALNWLTELHNPLGTAWDDIDTPS